MNDGGKPQAIANSICPKLIQALGENKKGLRISSQPFVVSEFSLVDNEYALPESVRRALSRSLSADRQAKSG